MSCLRFVFILLFFNATSLQAQYKANFYSASLNPSKSSTIAGFSSYTWVQNPNPRTAAILSAVVPGSGQIYNGKWWKAGIVYAATGGLVYMLVSNQQEMKQYQQALEARLDSNQTNNNFPNLSTAALRSNRDFYRRYRDISILAMAAVYALQIIDANVDAHLREFDVNEDLSFRPDYYWFNGNHMFQLSLQYTLP